MLVIIAHAYRKLQESHVIIISASWDVVPVSDMYVLYDMMVNAKLSFLLYVIIKSCSTTKDEREPRAANACMYQ